MIRNRGGRTNRGILWRRSYHCMHAVAGCVSLAKQCRCSTVRIVDQGQNEVIVQMHCVAIG